MEKYYVVTQNEKLPLTGSTVNSANKTTNQATATTDPCCCHWSGWWCFGYNDCNCNDCNCNDCNCGNCDCGGCNI